MSTDNQKPPRKNPFLDNASDDLDRTRVDIPTAAPPQKLADAFEHTLPGVPTSAKKKNEGPDIFDKTLPGTPDSQKSLEETAIFAAPPSRDEDTSVNISLYDLDEPTRFLKSEEPAKISEAEPSQNSEDLKKRKSEGSKKQKGPNDFLGLLREPQKIFEALFTVFGLLVLLLLTSAGFQNKSPLANFFAISTGISLGAAAGCFFWKKTFSAAVPILLCVFFFGLADAIAGYGSADPKAWALFGKHPYPASFLNFIFLGIGIRILLHLLFQKRVPKIIGWILALPVFYTVSGYATHLLQTPSIAFEDALFGTRLFQSLPENIRPVRFSLQILFPILTVYALAAFGWTLVKKRNEAFSAFHFLNLCALTTMLGFVILSANRLSGFAPNWVLSKNGASKTAIFQTRFGFDSLTLGYDAGPLQAYGMAAALQISENKHFVDIRLRGQNGQILTRLDPANFKLNFDQKPLVIQNIQEVSQRPIAQNFIVLFESDGTTQEIEKVLREGLKDLPRFLNSQETAWVGDLLTNSFIHLKDISDLKSVIIPPNDEEIRNLKKDSFEARLAKMLGQLESIKGDVTVLFVFSNPETWTHEAQARLQSWRQAHPVSFLFLQTGDTPLKVEFEKDLRAKVFKTLSEKDATFAIPAMLAAAFPDYQLSYEMPAFIPELSWTGPQNGEEILADANFGLEIKNFEKSRLKSAKIFLDDKIIEEKKIENAKIAFKIPYATTEKGEHRIKMSVENLEDSKNGKEFFTEEIKLVFTVPASLKIVEPTNAANLTGEVQIKAEVNGPPSKLPVKVEFMIDGKKVHETERTPYALTWDTKSLKGSHTIEVTATFKDGSQKRESVSVTIQAPTTRPPRRGPR